MIEKIITKHLQKKKRQHKDNSKFRVSDAGRCHLMRYWKRQGRPFSDIPDERTLRVFEVGHIFHSWLQDILEKEGVLVGKELRVEDEHRIGHIDSVVKTASGIVLYDFKTVHSRKFHWKRKQGLTDTHYALQALTYASLLDFRVDDVRIAYISKDDLYIEEVPCNGMTININDDWKPLIAAWERQEEPIPNPASWECDYCVYCLICEQKGGQK